MPYELPFLQTATKVSVAVKRTLQLPCSDPAAVFVEYSLAVASGIVKGIISPDAKEVYHKLVGESLVHTISRGVEQTVEDVAPSLTKATRWLHKFAAGYDVATWWTFIIESGASGLLQANAAIYRMNKCTDKLSPYYGSGGWYVSAIPDDGRWQGIDIAIDQPHSAFYPVKPSHIRPSPSGIALIGVSARFVDFSDQQVGTNARIVRSDTGAFLDYDANGLAEDLSVHPTHTWFHDKRDWPAGIQLNQEFQYDGPPLQLGEAFPDPYTVNGYFYGT
ncbi:MAG TPA: hypothetical protein VHD95_11605 [Rhizomicrobium sp.]|nr:hypothetical protein [Rhizomicrobium sp.]